MASFLPLCSVAFALLTLPAPDEPAAGGPVVVDPASVAAAAVAAPPGASEPEFDPAAADACPAQDLSVFREPAPGSTQSCSVWGNWCQKTYYDCRPPGEPECSTCWCIGPVGDKWCACTQ